MTSFTYIFSSFFSDINTRKPAYAINNHNIINKEFIVYGFINSLQFKSSHRLRFSKYNILYEGIINNKFISSEVKNKIITAFYKSQKIYFAFSKLAFLYKYKKSAIFDIDTDLCMIPLSSLPQRILLKSYSSISKIIYYFRISDIINIINISLSNSPDFFSEPIIPKNPYTNIEFTKAQLFNIYFTISDSNFVMPPLLHFYFLSNFDIDDFAYCNEPYIRDCAISNFIKEASRDNKYEQAHTMLIEYKRCMPSIVIHSKFSKEIFVKTFEKYLQDYLTSKYSFGPQLREKSRKKLTRELSRFNKLNPTFGRKIFYSKSPRPITLRPQFTIDTNFSRPIQRNLQQNTYFFVEHVFIDSPRIPIQESDKELMGLSEGQMIIPPLVEQNNSGHYSIIPERVRDNLDRIINSTLTSENVIVPTLLQNISNDGSISENSDDDDLDVDELTNLEYSEDTMPLLSRSQTPENQIQDHIISQESSTQQHPPSTPPTEQNTINTSNINNENNENIVNFIMNQLSSP